MGFTGTFWFKVARVVNLKLAFTEWFFYNLVILIKLCKIWYLNLDKVLLFPRNWVICLKNWKLRPAPTTIKFDIFFWNFAHVFCLTMSTKECSGFFWLVPQATNLWFHRVSHAWVTPDDNSEFSLVTCNIFYLLWRVS